jgi:hypothetical protein
VGVNQVWERERLLNLMDNFLLPAGADRYEGRRRLETAATDRRAMTWLTNREE